MQGSNPLGTGSPPAIRPCLPASCRSGRDGRVFRAAVVQAGGLLGAGLDRLGVFCMQSGVGVTRSAGSGFWCRGARYASGFAVALAVWLLPPLAPAAEGPATPAGEHGPAPARTAERRSALVLSGMQYGLPVADTVIAGAVAALKQKGAAPTTSTSNPWTSSVTQTRADGPRWPPCCATSWRTGRWGW